MANWIFSADLIVTATQSIFLWLRANASPCCVGPGASTPLQWPGRCPGRVCHCCRCPFNNQTRCLSSVRSWNYNLLIHRVYMMAHGGIRLDTTPTCFIMSLRPFSAAASLSSVLQSSSPQKSAFNQIQNKIQKLPAAVQLRQMIS